MDANAFGFPFKAAPVIACSPPTLTSLTVLTSVRRTDSVVARAPHLVSAVDWIRAAAAARRDTDARLDAAVGEARRLGRLVSTRIHLNR